MTTPLPASPFMNSAASVPPVASAETPSESRFDRLFDPEKFLFDICVGSPDIDALAFAIVTGEEPAPKFLADPSPEYLRAAEIEPVLQVLARY